MTSKEVFELPTLIRKRLKKEAKNIDEWTELHKKNPELAKLVSDTEEIITGWAYGIIARIEAGE